MKYKIALYGFGSLPVVYRHLIERARSENRPIEWCAILTLPNYRSLIGEVMPTEDTLDLFKTLPSEPAYRELSCLSNYHGSIVEDLAAQKRTRRNRSGTWRLARAAEIYSLYKEFLLSRGATHILMSVIETPDAKIAVAAAKEIGVGVLAPIDLRNLTGTYFSVDCHETPPDYAAASAQDRARARHIVDRFRANPAPARHPPTDSSDEDQILLADYLPAFANRVLGFVKNAIERPDLFEPDMLRISVMNSLAPLRNVVRGIRKRRNTAQYDVASLDKLPERFVFYPLQYSPEASINTPAAYFVDQFRAIDALRFAMPSDHTLVVKEHPACLEMRPIDFMRRLRNLPGVIAVRADVPALQIMKRAAVTATVTGTAAFEAFLMGYPAVALGPGLSSWALGGCAKLGTLREDLSNAIGRKPTDDFIIDQVAKLLSVRYPFYFGSPHLPGEPILRAGNIRRFLDAIVDHLARERCAESAEDAHMESSSFTKRCVQ